MTRAPSHLSSLAGLVAATVLLPLAVMLLGVWERERAAADWAELDAQHLNLTRIVQDLEAREPRDGRIDFRMQFRRNGQVYGGPLALVQARAARDEAATLTRLMDWRRMLPPVVIAAGGLAAALSILVLLAGAVLGWMGRASRDVLVAGFSLVRRLLPPILAIQVLLTAGGFVAAVIVEAGILARPGLGSGEIKLLLAAAVAVGAVLVTAGATVLGLRRALAAFEPDPLPIFGRTVSPAEAPGLWRLTEGLAERLGALTPDAVVVGLTGGFFVSAGPAVVEPGGERLTGRILYLPLPYLALMRGDEVAAIIGHELAHYAGGDTVYSQRFLPIYAGVGRSLDAVAEGHAGSFGLLTPSLRLGAFVMERFHLAVRHWSRAREFAADAAGAGPTSPDAAARALLRTGAVQPRIAEVLDAAAEKPGSAPADLVAAILDHVIARGLDDPAAHLEAEQLHPTDTHPPTRERIAALGRPLDADLLAASAIVPPPHALGQLAAYFVDPAGLCRAATADFRGAVEEHDAAVRAHLEATAAAIDAEERVLRENSRPGAIVLIVAGLLFAMAALAFVALGFPGLAAWEARLVAAVALACGIGLAGFGLFRLWRGERTTMILRPEALTIPGLDRPIPWDDMADLDMTLQQTGIVTRLLLPPEAPFPQRVPGGRKIRLDPKRRIVTIWASLPRRMTLQDFADLIGRYRQAAEARRVLAEAGSSPARATSHARAP
ncbi:M48 family metallopeptidase [Methylobacterium sp. E-045]|uniref:M48 family metallopeptidase n=1 Tax=Methylobacterium sp. E-045 TaxID=2836575 RepID=UPI001FB9F8E3|nr:M48 family metallopeptidase [Methylobacterium sp. E-045]MCJ2131381.1 M48 family metallopeptidase [Methylobacterium sp. E-045]